MQLISLNTWGGKVFEPLMDFIRQHSKNTDIFCFQEIYNTKSSVTTYHYIRANLLEEIKKILPGFQCFYCVEFTGYDSCPDKADFDLTVGKAIFVKKNVDVSSQSELYIFGDKNERVLKKDFSNLPVSLQYVDIELDGKPLAVGNFHGTAFPGSKLDTPLRFKQSTDILAFLKSKSGAKIITGDFNLLPPNSKYKNDRRKL